MEEEETTTEKKDEFVKAVGTKKFCMELLVVSQNLWMNHCTSLCLSFPPPKANHFCASLCLQRGTPTLLQGTDRPGSR